MTPLALAWANLAHKRTRSAIAAAGVAFAVVLIFMEIGLYGGVERTATMLFDKLRFDLILVSSEYLDLSRPAGIPRDRLAQARSAEGVEDVIPVSIGVGLWRQPTAKSWPWQSPRPSGTVSSISILAVPPAQTPRAFTTGVKGAFSSPARADDAGERIAQLDAFLFDRRSRPEFGTLAELQSEGAVVRLNGRQAIVAGEFELGAGFSWNGMILCGEETFYRYMPVSNDTVNFGLIQLLPGSDPVRAGEELAAKLPADVQIYTREQIDNSERRYWMKFTSIGQFLLVAVVLAVVVGVIFVYQMMAADIRNMLPEYATVKALGYRPGYLSLVVLWQALLLAALGFMPGLAVAAVLYEGARSVGGIPTQMTLATVAGVSILTATMCLSSGLLAVRRVHSADPADLF